MEKFDVLNEFGEFTGKVATREECHKKGYWHRAVYAFIIDENSSNGTFISDRQILKGVATPLKNHSFLKLSRGNGGAVIFCSF